MQVVFRGDLLERRKFPVGITSAVVQMTHGTLMVFILSFQLTFQTCFDGTSVETNCNYYLLFHIGNDKLKFFGMWIHLGIDG